MTTDVPDVLSPRVAALYHDDVAFRAAEPLAQIRTAARRPGLRLVQVLQTLMDGYADRPAMAMRASEVANDPATGRFERHLRPDLETITYGDLWSDVRAIAAVWSGDEVPVSVGDFVASIGFASADYLRVDLVCAYLGLVSVPLQHNSTVSRLQPIFAEIQPRVVAAGADYLDLAVEAALGSPAVRRVEVFDYDAGVDDPARRCTEQGAGWRTSGLASNCSAM